MDKGLRTLFEDVEITAIGVDGEHITATAAVDGHIARQHRSDSTQLRIQRAFGRFRRPLVPHHIDQIRCTDGLVPPGRQHRDQPPLEVSLGRGTQQLDAAEESNVEGHTGTCVIHPSMGSPDHLTRIHPILLPNAAGGNGADRPRRASVETSDPVNEPRAVIGSHPVTN